jgi:hypothetical protein
MSFTQGAGLVNGQTRQVALCTQMDNFRRSQSGFIASRLRATHPGSCTVALGFVTPVSAGPSYVVSSFLIGKTSRGGIMGGSHIFCPGEGFWLAFDSI